MAQRRHCHVKHADSCRCHLSVHDLSSCASTEDMDPRVLKRRPPSQHHLMPTVPLLKRPRKSSTASTILSTSTSNVTDTLIELRRVAQAITHTVRDMPIRFNNGSYALLELRRVTRTIARASIQHALVGYTTYNGKVIPPAQINLIGCWLAQKAATSGNGTGYVVMAPWGLAVPLGKKKNFSQGIHRLAVIGYADELDKLKLLSSAQHHASHRCHNPACFNPGHIVVETAAANADRKRCNGRIDRLVRLHGIDYSVKDTQLCPHYPPCIAQRAEATVQAVSCQAIT